MHPEVEARLARLASDQRDAATAPPGPILCVAPAGSGKTTTLVARIAWLLATGAAAPGRIAAITFNKRAAVELDERLATALGPLALAGDPVRVRTFHALGWRSFARAERRSSRSSTGWQPCAASSPTRVRRGGGASTPRSRS
jgi:DNA helicase-2/ATP-dependent DNA helicase PcrA